MIVSILSTTPLWSAEKSPETANAKTAHSIIDKKCTKCHSGSVIDTALKEKKDMLKIQKEMEKRGAKLSSKEQEVLGIFWKQQNPLKQSK